MKKCNRFLLAVTTVVICSLIAFGCSANSKGKGDKPVVVTTFSVTADIVSNVAGDRADVASLTKPGTEIHHYEPTPKDIVRAQKADLIMDNGLNLELWFEPFFSGLSDVKRVTLSDGIDLIPIAGGSYEGKPNPHAWMSPKNAIIYAENARDALIELDPAGEDAYRHNTKTYIEKLQRVDKDLSSIVAGIPKDKRVLATCEGAFTYLTRDYDLTELYLWPINADQQGTPSQVRDLISEVQERDVSAVFCESTVSADPMKEVAKATGSKYGGDLFVDSLSTPEGPVPTYLDLLQHDVKVISEMAGEAS